MKRKDAYNKEVEEAVKKSMATKTKQPRFSYAHFFLPHGQFYRDSSGAFNPPEKILDLKYLADKSLYLSYLKYTNNIINGLVKQLNTNDPNAIVIIISDHGFYDYNNAGDYDPYNFDNICFVRFPGKTDTVNLPRSNVNFFRYFFNTAYGQNLPYIKDSTVYVIEDPAVLR
jgi:membrane-anchored protein YejM (alkaline phosphatase superfamily)